ncbi:MAG: TOMM precursor leader peptide-binding protein, partial [Acidobacteriota bacterium]
MLRRVIEELREQGLLESALGLRPSPAEKQASTAVDHLADVEGFDDRSSLVEILQRAKVGVWGSPAFTRPLAGALARFGVESTSWSRIPTEETPWGCDLVVALESGPGARSTLLELNEHAVRFRRCLLPIQIDGFRARFGPLVMAGEGPCYHCFDRRRAANQEEETEGQLVDPRASVHQPAAALAAELAALEAVRVLTHRGRSDAPELSGAVKDLDLSSSTHELHRLLPLPFCPVCGPSFPPSTAPRKRPPEIPGPEVFDELCGLVKTCVDRSPRTEDEPRVSYIATEATASARFGTGIVRAARFGCGVDVDESKARGAALGEIIERYSAAHYDVGALRHCRYLDLD